MGIYFSLNHQHRHSSTQVECLQVVNDTCIAEKERQAGSERERERKQQPPRERERGERMRPVYRTQVEHTGLQGEGVRQVSWALDATSNSHPHPSIE